ncbi:MAG: hypothetical protein Kow00102_05580 [Spirochaetota bacterium]
METYIFHDVRRCIIIVFLAVIMIFVSTCSTPEIKEKPQPVIFQGSREIPEYNKLHTIDSVAINNPELLKTIQTIILEYKLNIDGSQNTGLAAIWNQEIQKALLRKGFYIQQASTPDLFFEENPSTNQNKTICVIDTLSIRKETETITLEDTHIQNPLSYNYSYYVADISACINHNDTIVWRGNVTVTSFDLLIHKKNITRPIISYTITIDYIYSKKINDWIKQNAEIALTDNFSKYYTTHSSEDLHKKELIEYTVTTLFNSFKVAK